MGHLPYSFPVFYYLGGCVDIFGANKTFSEFLHDMDIEI